MPGEITVGAQGKHVQQYGVAAHETFINKLVFIATVCVGSAVHSHVEQCGDKVRLCSGENTSSRAPICPRACVLVSSILLTCSQHGSIGYTFYISRFD